MHTSVLIITLALPFSYAYMIDSGQDVVIGAGLTFSHEAATNLDK